MRLFLYFVKWTASAFDRLLVANVEKGGFDAVVDVCFIEDVSETRLDGLGAQEKFSGNFFVGHAFADECHDLHFPS